MLRGVIFLPVPPNPLYDALVNFQGECVCLELDMLGMFGVGEADGLTD